MNDPWQQYRGYDREWFRPTDAIEIKLDGKAVVPTDESGQAPKMGFVVPSGEKDEAHKQ